MSWSTHAGGRLTERGDDTARTVTTYDEAGQVTGTRPYTTAENTAADAAQAEEAAREERRVKAERDQAILDATAALMEDTHTDGAAWVQPTGAHNAFPKGATVTHNGKDWESLTPANVWPPGVTGWREVVAEGPAAWAQPLGAHDAYPLGSKVTHKGKTWTSTIAANVWKPGVYGWA